MINIEIVCLNYNLADRIAETLSETLKSKGIDSVYFDPYGNLFARVIRLVKTHSSLAISKQSSLLLDAAREWDVRINFFRDMPNKENKVVVSPYSLTMDAIYQCMISFIEFKKVFSRMMIKKLIGPPDYIIYLNVEYKTLIKIKASRIWGRKVSVNTKGVGLKTRMKWYPLVLEKISKLFKKTKCCIIEVQDHNDTVSINKQILEFLESNK